MVIKSRIAEESCDVAGSGGRRGSRRSAICCKNTIGEVWSSVKPLILKGSFAVFDFDNTIIDNDISDLFFCELCRGWGLKNYGLVEGRDIFLPGSTGSKYSVVANSIKGKKSNKRAGEGELKKYHEKVWQRYYYLHHRHPLRSYDLAARMLVGLSIREIEEVIDRVLRRAKRGGMVEYAGIRVRAGVKPNAAVREIMKYLDLREVKLHIVSASPQVIVEQVCRRILDLPVIVHGVKQMVVRGVITSRKVEPVCAYDGKIACITSFNFKKKPILGVGDSFNDCFMLSYAKVACVVDRGTAFSKYACRRGWYVI